MEIIMYTNLKIEINQNKSSNYLTKDKKWVENIKSKS